MINLSFFLSSTDRKPPGVGRGRGRGGRDDVGGGRRQAKGGGMGGRGGMDEGVGGGRGRSQGGGYPTGNRGVYHFIKSHSFCMLFISFGQLNDALVFFLIQVEVVVVDDC